MSDASQYDADYFLRGKQTGKSLYEDYRWLPDLTIPMVKAIINYLCIFKSNIILDFGCARGYVVKALRGLGYNAYGYDISEWAIENADPEAYHYLTTNQSAVFGVLKTYDWIIAKDVLEHVKYVERVITELMNVAVKGVFAVVPLSNFNNGRYVIDDYEKDVTHIQRWPLGTWVNMFLRPGWLVEASYRIPGIKDNYYKPMWEKGNGFIVARRIGES